MKYFDYLLLLAFIIYLFYKSPFGVDLKKNLERGITIDIFDLSLNRDDIYYKFMDIIKFIRYLIKYFFGGDDGDWPEFRGDTGYLWQLSFQDPATVSMEGIFLFNIHLLFVIIGIVFVVSWLIYCIVDNFLELTGSSKILDFTHSEFIEIVWTSLPTLILLSLAYPSFSLLYSLDEISAPDLTIKIMGHQWYWSYEISDFNCCSKTKNLRYSAYMLSNEYLIKHSKLGLLRLLETNKKLVLPTNTHLRLLITSVDVLHSWTIPSFGVKVDACPGRLNQANLFIKRFGFFFGQCSEICGVNHGFMPIAVLALPSDQYYHIIASNLKF